MAGKAEFDKNRSYPWFTVKRLGNIGGWKVVSMKIPFDRGQRKRREYSEGRFDSSIARTRTAVKELAMCNPWEWFVTLTLSGEKVADRHDLEAYHTKLTDYIQGLNKRREPSRKITYILVPERHKDGAWHMHGLINGLDEQDVKVNEHGYYDWWPYRRNFGWISLGRIKSRMGVIGYICKYVSKSLAAELHKSDAHMYYRSRGLIEPASFYRGYHDADTGYDGRWSFTKPDIGMKVAYVRDLNGVQLPEQGDMDIARERAAMAAELAAATVPTSMEELGLVVDGYAPICFDDLH